MGLVKRTYTDQETVITAENLNEIQDAILALEDGLFSVDNDKGGASITITDAAKRGFRSLNIFGKTMQDGTPTPDAPVDLVSVGGGGNITVTLTSGDGKTQKATFATPNGLPGVPVAVGGNHTDANGQQWVCDEIDLFRGVYVKRLAKFILDGSADEQWVMAEKNGTNDGVLYSYLGLDTPHNAYCTHYAFLYDPKAAYAANRGRFDIHYGQFRVNAYGFEDTETFRAFLTNSPMTLIAPLTTPIETPLTEEELGAYAALYTYKDHTTVSNDAGAYMELEYVMDSQKYFNEHLREIIADSDGTTLAYDGRTTKGVL